MFKKYRLTMSILIATMLFAPFAGAAENADSGIAQATPQMQERAANLSRILNLKPEYRRGVFMY